MKLYKYLHIVIGSAILFTACSVTKQIPDRDALYTGASIKVKNAADSSKAKSRKQLSDDLQALLRPVPNKSFLGMYPKLAIFNMVDTPSRDKGFKYWLKYKVGEPPVLASSVNLDKNREIMESRLDNLGYFKSTVTVDTTVKHKKMHADYTVYLNRKYYIRNMFYPTDSSRLSIVVQKAQKTSPLKKGRSYNLDYLLNDRARLNNRLKENGFYYFNPEDIIYDVDSTVGDHQLDIYMRIRKQTPPKDLTVYHIKNIFVFADYNGAVDTMNLDADSIPVFKGLHIIDPEEKFNPKLFSRTMLVQPKQIYRQSVQASTVSRLVSLGAYKFVKVRFQEVDSSKKALLDAYYYLTPQPRKSISLEVSGLTKSNNSTGTELSINWKNRNTFRGAEVLTARAYGGFEKQVAGAVRVNTLTAGGNVSLAIPRILGPVKIKASNAFVPQTLINVGYDLFARDTQYTLNSFHASVANAWKTSVRSEHTWNYLSFTYVRPTNITQQFQQQLDTNITLARSIEKQFILGMIYNYNFNTQAVPNKRRNNIYLNLNGDISGNVAGIITGASAKDNDQKYILGVPFSQYLRFEADFRHYLRFNKSTTLASRFTGGFGYAYGNSLTMPFVKEFFAGGVNDIRAFRARSLGPGSFYAGNPKEVYVPDQPGDIKLEFNTELRQKLFSLLYGAVFVDAGNIWTLRNDPTRPGSQFSGKFLNDFAVGTGIGLRVDIKFFVIRADLAMPVRKPYITTGSKWVFNQIDLGNSDWRKENLVLNIAIGYPF